MPALYSAAELFAFPTLYEGFGIPVLEAQACGTPVLTSNGSSLPEVGGEGAVYVDPYDTEGICAGMRHVLDNPEIAQQLVQKGLANVQRFSWQASAERLDEMIETIIDRRRR
jgi:glycosyltransferase involved in cell wall biosynthesis